jgi:cell wall-associated NlpC family hydrolase
MMRTRVLSTLVMGLLLTLLAHPAAAVPVRQELARARAQLDDLSRELEIQIEECNLHREQLKAVKRQVRRNERKLGETRSTLTSVDQQRSDVVATLYKQRTGGQQLASLTTSLSDLSDYAERMAWLDVTNRARTSSFERYTAVRDRLEADGQLLAAARDEAARANARAQRTCDETRREVEAQEDRIGELAAEVERLEARARERAERSDQPAPEATPPSTSGGQSTPVSAPAVSGSAGTAVQFALAQVGKPYGWGGSGPGSYDCSGLTSAAWAAAGRSLPHNSGMQYSATSRVSRSAVQPGDLMFFGSPIHHVAMYIGNGQMVESPRSGLTVRVVSANRSDFVGAGRP